MLLACAGLPALAGGGDWTHLAGDAARAGLVAGPVRIDTAAWSAQPAIDEEFVWRSSPVVAGGRVFVNARYFPNGRHEANRLIAYDAADGGRLWHAALPADYLESWSSPAVDADHGLVLLATDEDLVAIDLLTGDERWRTRLSGPVVNCSPAVTTGLERNGVPANLALVADHAPFGTGRLHGVNLDPFDAASNPFQPGDIAWTQPLPGTSGATPAFADGVTVVASATGSLHAFDARDGGERWATPVSLDGFFGGVTVRDSWVFAATYDFNGSGDRSDLVKVELATGGLVWRVGCERTAAIPVVADDGRIFIAAGIAGFGSAVKVQAFRDHGDRAELLWDTWVDTDGLLTVGGWTHHAVLVGADRLLAGVPDGPQFFDPYRELLLIDLSRTPADPAFIADRHVGAGGSPAVADGVVYSIGTGGLLALGGCESCDTNCDGALDAFDIEPFVAVLFGGQAPCSPCAADANGDGRVDAFDIEAFLACLFP